MLDMWLARRREGLTSGIKREEFFLYLNPTKNLIIIC
jgi:hypothetical protein